MINFKNLKALSGKNEADDIDAIFHAMVPDDPDDRLFQISVNDLLSGNQKTLLTMCWQLIQIFWEKFAPAPSNERKMVEALKEWLIFFLFLFHLHIFSI